ncbi:Snf5- protein 1 [Gaertneriomyces sp. JEL0708]|nr:Snf5- protein 1 [Gaertneriomyces sp. JEL0708]
MSTNIYSSSAYVDSEYIEGEEPVPPKPKRDLGDFKYKSDKRQRSKGAKHYYYKQQLKDLAERPVQLVPVRIDVEVEGVKLKDQFTWNLNETLVTPEQFAQLLADDFDSPYAQQFVPLVAEEIRRQVQMYGGAAEEDPTGDGKPRITDEESDERDYGDIRIVINLDIQVGTVHLRDRFEWPLLPTSGITPEDFAKQLAGDLGVGGEFVPTIAHAIREQVCLARLNWDDAIPAPSMRGRPFRPESMDDDWEPELRELTEQELDRIAREKERQTRRLRRQHRQSNYGRQYSSGISNQIQDKPQPRDRIARNTATALYTMTPAVSSTPIPLHLNVLSAASPYIAPMPSIAPTGGLATIAVDASESGTLPITSAKSLALPSSLVTHRIDSWEKAPVTSQVHTLPRLLEANSVRSELAAYTHPWFSADKAIEVNGAC